MRRRDRSQFGGAPPNTARENRLERRVVPGREVGAVDGIIFHAVEEVAVDVAIPPAKRRVEIIVAVVESVCDRNGVRAQLAQQCIERSPLVKYKFY